MFLFLSVHQCWDVRGKYWWSICVWLTLPTCTGESSCHYSPDTDLGASSHTPPPLLCFWSRLPKITDQYSFLSISPRLSFVDTCYMSLYTPCLDHAVLDNALHKEKSTNFQEKKWVSLGYCLPLKLSFSPLSIELIFQFMKCSDVDGLLLIQWNEILILKLTIERGPLIVNNELEDQVLSLVLSNVSMVTLMSHRKCLEHCINYHLIFW